VGHEFSDLAVLLDEAAAAQRYLDALAAERVMPVAA